MELAALPGCAAEHCATGGAQPGMVVGDDIFHPAHPTSLEAFEEAPPMHLCLRQRDRDAEHPAALIGADTHGREDGGIAHDPAVAHLLVPGVEDQIPSLAEGPGAPSLQVLVEQLGCAADLRRRQAFDAELAHDRLRLAGRHAFDVHFRHCQHHRADRAATAFERLRVEGLAPMIGSLGNLHRDRAGRRVDALGLVAVGITLPLDGPLVAAGSQEPLPLDLHGQLERPREDRRDVVGAVFDQMFQDSLNRRILPFVHSRLSMVV
jgi:hypothetical protein